MNKNYETKHVRSGNVHVLPAFSAIFAKTLDYFGLENTKLITPCVFLFCLQKCFLHA
jgi:hypothetical protein